ncbi:biotin/lipoyl-binding protein [Hoeflea alexandrii]|uniref:biotin/lipoyl-binding protein n=1 Tax=Hoeflea alexandrii TaxID=288436 RepID=UPI0035D04C31
MSTQANPTETPAQLAKANKPSRLRRNVLMLLVPCLLIAGGLYAWITGGRYEETENANMRLARITIASEIAGRVVSVNVAENVSVKKGDVLFQVDPQPLKIALDQADAAVESARLQVIELKAGYSQALT